MPCVALQRLQDVTWRGYRLASVRARMVAACASWQYLAQGCRRCRPGHTASSLLGPTCETCPVSHSGAVTALQGARRCILPVWTRFCYPPRPGLPSLPKSSSALCQRLGDAASPKPRGLRCRVCNRSCPSGPTPASSCTTQPSSLRCAPWGPGAHLVRLSLACRRLRGLLFHNHRHRRNPRRSRRPSRQTQRLAADNLAPASCPNSLWGSPTPHFGCVAARCWRQRELPAASPVTVSPVGRSCSGEDP